MEISFIIAFMFQEIPNIKVQINNHTDSIETNDINQFVSDSTNDTVQFESDSYNSSSETELINKIVDEKSHLPLKSDLRKSKDKELFLDLINLLENYKNKNAKCKENENKNNLNVNKGSEIVESSNDSVSAINEHKVIEQNVSGNKHLDDSVETGSSSARKLCDISLLDLLRKHKNETKNNVELPKCSATVTKVAQLVSSKLEPENNLNNDNKNDCEVLIPKQQSIRNNWDMSLLDLFRKHKSINNESQDSLSVMEKDT